MGARARGPGPGQPRARVRGPGPGLHNHSVAILAHASLAGSSFLARSSLQDLQLRGISPDVITYNAAVSAREKGRKPQQALNLLQEMQLRSLLPDVIEIASRDRRTLLVLRIRRSAFSIAGRVPDGLRTMSGGVALGRRP